MQHVQIIFHIRSLFTILQTVRKRSTTTDEQNTIEQSLEGLEINTKIWLKERVVVFFLFKYNYSWNS